MIKHPMLLFFVLSGLVLIAIGGVSIQFCGKMRSDFGLDFLHHYFLYAVFYYTSGFLDAIVKNLAYWIINCRTTPAPIIGKIDMLFGLIAMPFMIIAVYFLLRMLSSVAGKTMPRWGVIVYFLAETALLLHFSQATFRLRDNPPPAPIYPTANTALLFQAVNLALTCAFLLWMILSPKRYPGRLFRTALNTYGIITIVTAIARFLLIFGISNDNLACSIYPYVIFLTPVPPLIYLRHAGRRFFINEWLRPDQGASLNDFFALHQISKREQEIFRLVLSGRSNRQIEGELFISLQTVKSHVSNIYRKLGVKSRWQLLNLVQNRGYPRQKTDAREY
jgi:DNA-binding CsgD family transcriptional regulator